MLVPLNTAFASGEDFDTICEREMLVSLSTYPNFLKLVSVAERYQKQYLEGLDPLKKIVGELRPK